MAGQAHRTVCHLTSGALAAAHFMNPSSNDPPEIRPAASPETPSDFQFELPVEPGYRERPPKGSWEAGYRLSLAALELVKNRPEVFAERDRQMCDVEFKA
jgi:hypothetical protein